MVKVTRMVLDVLKPHHPNGLEFASAIADGTPDCRVKLSVSAMDEKTETVVLAIEGPDLAYDSILQKISHMGGSVHSIDEVQVQNLTVTEPD
ncbi:MAG: DUF211 domain-containing protein [Gammaproteobacteria bacterium]|nr:DUF211 domain-containing protein [Gammaproteobacteria bacterium]